MTLVHHKSFSYIRDNTDWWKEVPDIFSSSLCIGILTIKHPVKTKWAYSLVYNNFPLFCGLQHIWRGHVVNTNWSHLLNIFVLAYSPGGGHAEVWPFPVPPLPLLHTRDEDHRLHSATWHFTTWLTHLGSPMSSLTSECNFIVMKSFPIPYEFTRDNTLM